MSEHLTIDPIMQKDAADCAVACLAMLLGVGYQQARSACPRNVGSEGLTPRQIRNVAKKLGQPLRYLKVGRFDPDNVVGVLHLQRPFVDSKDVDYHVAVIVNGVIYNPADGLIWTSAEALNKARRWEPLGVFVRQEDRTR